MFFAQRLLPGLQWLLTRPNRPASPRVVLYGALEDLSTQAVDFLGNAAGIKITGFVDRKAEGGEFSFCGLPVRAPGTLSAREFDYVIVLGRSQATVDAMVGFLTSLGLTRGVDFFDSGQAPEFEWNTRTIGPLATKFYEWDFEVISHIGELPQYYPDGALARLRGIASAQGYDYRGKTIFEIGYGPSLIVPVVFCLLGAKKVYACDFVKTPLRDTGLMYENLPAPYRRLCSLVFEHPEALAWFGKPSYDAFFAELRDIIQFDPASKTFRFNPDRIVVLNGADGNLETIAIPDGEVDFAYSNGVLEHIDRLDTALAQLDRVMKPGACAWHIITCAMHWNFRGFDGDPSKHPLEFLKYHPDTYAQMQEGHWGYERPWRLSDYVKALQESGMAVEVLSAQYADEALLPAKIDPWFDRYDPLDLRSTGAIFWTRKPGP